MSFLSSSDKKRNKICLICSTGVTDTVSSPDLCNHVYHYACLRNYVDSQLDNKKSVICPEISCKKFFGRIAYRHRSSNEVFYQNSILSNDETQCCICFSKYTIPVASTDSCSHTFCYECLKKWCTFKHECPMDRTPIKMLLISDFPGGLILRKVEPPAIEQDLNGDGDNDELINTTCEFCNSGQNEHQLLLCDNCNRGYHIYCLPVPLAAVPEGDWFCENCQDHNDDQQEIAQVPDGGLQRGLGRVVADFQNRYGNENAANRRRQRRVNTSNGRATRRSVRPTTNTRHISSDDEVSSEDEIVATQDIVINSEHTNYSYNFRARNEGVRTRGSQRTLIEEDENMELTLTSRLRRRARVVRIESEEEEQSNAANQIRNIRASPIANNNLRTAVRRIQGSLSSDIESEVEPRRKRQRVLESDEEADNTVKNSSGDSSSEEEAPNRLRANNHIVEESPVESMRRVVDDEDTEGEVIVHSVNVKKRLFIDSSGSSDDETDAERQRHVSTSSSLSTIPCRAPETFEAMSNRLSQPKTINNAANLEIETEDMSASDKKTDSETDWEPSPSVVRRPPQQRNRRRKKPRRAGRPRRKAVAATDDDDETPEAAVYRPRVTISIRAPKRAVLEAEDAPGPSTEASPALSEARVRLEHMVTASLARHTALSPGETASLTARILEKIGSRHGDDSTLPNKRKVVDFVAKYVSFYLKKRR